MNHLVGHVGGEVLEQLRVTLEKGLLTLISDAMKIVDLGDESIPVLPEDFDRLHGQRAITHIRVKAALDQPFVGNLE